ncbi:MAG: septum formation initiator family protein [Candidatus Margulisbacteria bacterium]|nr:septum formation initiator family protein [Candidatus Margulisiibacteriota bacterium]MBU1617279.1 septum formation initiator family protein [Candidatus Margulisiibacteriota bacterium]MBU1866903.1 septum formation initiator family protein [Candidatus Margulisiibacteriota bacterium]
MKRLGSIAAILAIIYFIFLIRQDIINYRELSGAKDAAGKRVTLEEVRYQGLNERLARLNTSDLTEEIARTKLGLIKKGETAYKVMLK